MTVQLVEFSVDTQDAESCLSYLASVGTILNSLNYTQAQLRKDIRSTVLEFVEGDGH